MYKLTHAILALLTAALVALALPGQGGTKASEGVTCSSTTQPSSGRSLTGKWNANNGGGVYSLFQKGTCLWWVGGSSNVFFGTVFGSTVTGIWADVALRKSGGLTLVLLSPNTLIRRGSAGEFRPTRLLRAS
jgi:hypothetical protein